MSSADDPAEQPSGRPAAPFQPWVEAAIPLGDFRRFESERVWLAPTEEAGVYRLGHPTFLAAQYQAGDRVAVAADQVTNLILTGGHRSYRALFPAALEPEELRLKLQQLEEFNAEPREASNHYFVIDIPPEANLNAVKAQLEFWAKRKLAQVAFEPHQIEPLSFALLDQPLIPCALPGGPSLPAVTTLAIAEHGDPILHVVRDRSEVQWQFLPWETPREEDACLATLQYLVQQDPSLNALAGLPLGWHAWREDPTDPWQAEPYSTG